MPGLDSLEDLFEATRQATEPAPEDEARLRRALARKIGGAALVGSAVASGTARAAATGAKMTSAGFFTKLAPIAVSLALGGAAGTAFEIARPPPRATGRTPVAENSAARGTTAHGGTLGRP